MLELSLSTHVSKAANIEWPYSHDVLFKVCIQIVLWAIWMASACGDVVPPCIPPLHRQKLEELWVFSVHSRIQNPQRAIV